MDGFGAGANRQHRSGAFVPGGGPGGGPRGYLGSLLRSHFFVFLSFAGIFVSKSKGAFLGFFKIVIISLVLCVKVIYTIFYEYLQFLDLNLVPKGPPKGPLGNPCFTLFRS